jgi:hypothetical protein
MATWCHWTDRCSEMQTIAEFVHKILPVFSTFSFHLFKTHYRSCLEIYSVGLPFMKTGALVLLTLIEFILNGRKLVTFEESFFLLLNATRPTTHLHYIRYCLLMTWLLLRELNDSCQHTGVLFLFYIQLILLSVRSFHVTIYDSW